MELETKVTSFISAQAYWYAINTSSSMCDQHGKGCDDCPEPDCDFRTRLNSFIAGALKMAVAMANERANKQ